MTIPRPLTGDELAYMRSDLQASQIFLAFPESHVIFAAQVDGTPGSLDQVVQIAYRDVTTGAYTDIPEMCTLWAGTAAGLYDKGIARIRKAADGSNLYIGETSSIRFADGDYLTVVDDFPPFQRFGVDLTVDPVTTAADYDIAFTDQYSAPNPIVNMGPDGVIYTPNSVVTGDNPATIPFDASGSYMPDGSGIASHSWGVIGSGLTFDDLGSATPVVSVTNTGTWKVYDTVTGSNGKSTTGWRTVTAHDKTHPPINQFNLTSPPTCDRDNDGGWNFVVRMYDQAAFSSVKDRQQVILFSRDWYGDQTSLYTDNISFDAPRTQYQGWFNYPNAASPQMTVGKKGVIEIQHISSANIAANVQQIRYRRVLTITGQQAVVTTWTATLQFGTVATLPIALRLRNPGGVIVMSYQAAEDSVQ